MCICIFQLQIFEMMFEGDDMTGIVSYSNKEQFKNNENDLLQLGHTVKLLHPLIHELKTEIKENRKIDLEIFRLIYKECLQLYFMKNKDCLQII